MELQADEIKSHGCEVYRKSVFLDNWMLGVNLWLSQLLAYVLLEVTLNGILTLNGIIGDDDYLAKQGSLYFISRIR